MNWHWNSDTKSFDLTMFEVKDYSHSFRLFALDFEILVRDRGFYFAFIIFGLIIWEMNFFHTED